MKIVEALTITFGLVLQDSKMPRSPEGARFQKLNLGASCFSGGRRSGAMQRKRQVPEALSLLSLELKS